MSSIVVAADDDLVRWLDATLRLMASEMQIEEPGYELIASRLADVSSSRRSGAR